MDVPLENTDDPQSVVSLLLVHLLLQVISYDMELLNATAFCSVSATPAIFFQASKSEVLKFMNELASHRGIPPHPAGKRYRCRHVLPVNMLSRLEDYEQHWSDHRVTLMHQGSPLDLDTKYLANISQNFGYSGKVMTMCPTLLRNSVIWGEEAERVLLPREHLGVQGMPVYAYRRPSRSRLSSGT